MTLIEDVKQRFGKPWLLKVHPLNDRRYDELGHCDVCGSNANFVFNSWVIPADMVEELGDPAVSFSYCRRESLFCPSCCSSLRVRNIAETMLSLYGAGATSIAEMVEEEEFRRLDLAEINKVGALGALHSFLSRLPRLAYSEYRGPTRLGEEVEGVRNEDICRLTYPEASFDLVLSSDTLEHVPDFRAALRETRRILRPGGRHVFTIPVVAGKEGNICEG